MSGAEVFINARFLTQPLTGVQRYARETVAALDRLWPALPLADVPTTLLAPAGARWPELRHLRVEHVGRRQGHWWEQCELPARVGQGLLLGLGFTGPLLLRRQLITVHDAAVLRAPGSYSLMFRQGYRGLVGLLCRRAAAVLAVSRFSASEAQQCFGAPADRVRQVTEGWQHMDAIQADASVLRRHGLADRPYLLAVSSPTPNKNFALIGRALALLGDQAPVCVVVGALAPGYRGATPVQTPTMRWLGRVSDGELKALYEGARAFVFPSFYEGFGIPPLEAMACGCPVLASTADAVRETCGDAALYFDPDDAAGLAQVIRRLWASEPLRRWLVKTAETRLARYSWERNARLHADILAEFL